MSTVLISHLDCLNHQTPSGHPEQVARMRAVLDALEGLPVEHQSAPLAMQEDLLLLHPPGYVSEIKENIPAQGLCKLDADTYVSPGSWDAALRGVGAAMHGVDLVMEGKARNVFCATRPPGHHAEYATSMGFCLFGNIALGAKHALERHGLERVAVVDFDVHHGNGTQDLLDNDPRALVITSHQSPLWPGSGDAADTGQCGNIMNVPLPPQSDGAHMREVYETHIFPRLDAFKPEMIFISAGFDAHQDDPLADLRWHETDFAWLTARICEIAALHSQGRVVSSLEGGYDLAALGRSAAAHVEELIKAGRDG